MNNLQHFLSMPVSGKKMILEINEQTGDVTKQKTRSGVAHFFKNIFRPYRVRNENQRSAAALLYLMKQNWGKFSDSEDGKKYFSENLTQCQRGSKALTDRDIKRMITHVNNSSTELLFFSVPFDTAESLVSQLLDEMGFETEDHNRIQRGLIDKGGYNLAEYKTRLSRFQEKNGILTDHQAWVIYRNFLRDKLIDHLLTDNYLQEWGGIADLKKILVQNHMTERHLQFYVVSELILRVMCMSRKNSVDDQWLSTFLRRHDEGISELDPGHDQPVYGRKMNQIDPESTLYRSLDCGMQIATRGKSCPVAVRKNAVPVTVIVDQHINGHW
jgi:hypothetical protein